MVFAKDLRMQLCLRPRLRKGAVVVEFAWVAPLFVLIFLGTLEMGRGLNVKHSLQEAARAGCRIAVLQGSTNDDIDALAEGSLLAADIDNYTISVSPTNFQDAEEGDAISVTIITPFSEVGWFASFFLDRDISGSCTMRAMRRPPVDYPEASPSDQKKAAKKVAKKAGKKDAKKVGKKANKKQQSLSWKKNKK
jgi:hypothetical protein